MDNLFQALKVTVVAKGLHNLRAVAQVDVAKGRHLVLAQLGLPYGIRVTGALEEAAQVIVLKLVEASAEAVVARAAPFPPPVV